jgi:hypothetical protein
VREGIDELAAPGMTHPSLRRYVLMTALGFVFASALFTILFVRSLSDYSVFILIGAGVLNVALYAASRSLTGYFADWKGRRFSIQMWGSTPVDDATFELLSARWDGESASLQSSRSSLRFKFRGTTTGTRTWLEVLQPATITRNARELRIDDAVYVMWGTTLCSRIEGRDAVMITVA